MTFVGGGFVGLFIVVSAAACTSSDPGTSPSPVPSLFPSSPSRGPRMWVVPSGTQKAVYPRDRLASKDSFRCSETGATIFPVPPSGAEFSSDHEIQVRGERDKVIVICKAGSPSPTVASSVSPSA
jgi:hypothetical protein